MKKTLFLTLLSALWLCLGCQAVAEEAAAPESTGDRYRVYVFDTQGSPVEGALIQLCDETACYFAETNGDGVAEFKDQEQKAYKVQVLQAPESYQPYTQVLQTKETYCDVNICLEKAP